jgi:hypothetical protein
MRTALITIAVVAALAGCGDSGDVSDRTLVQQTITRYFDATSRGDGGTACGLLTEQARKGFRAVLDVPPARDCEANVRKVARRNVPLRPTHISQVVLTTDRATAEVSSERPRYSNSVELARDRGTWKLARLPTEIRRYQLPRIAAPSHGHHIAHW